MAFFGVEIKPGKPFSHRFDNERGRLHLSQATLGIGSSTKKGFLQCNVGDKSPVLLCSLVPDQTESCTLDLEFEEEDEVLFSVLGPRSVHLTGYYIGNGCGHGRDGDDTDSYGEDIAETGSEESSDYDTDEDEYEDDFIDALDGYSPSRKPKSGVVIEELFDEKPANGNGDRKRPKKKHVKGSDGDDQQQLVVRGSNGILLSESEDEDGLPINSHLKSKSAVKKTEAEKKSEKKGSNKKADDGSDQVKGSKRKMDAIAQDGDTERVIERPNDSSVPSLEVEHESGQKPKKKKKKQRVKEAKNTEVEDDSKIDVPKEVLNGNQAVGNEQDEKPSNDKNVDVNSDHIHEDDAELKKKKKKKKKTKSKSQDSENIANAVEANKDSIVENEEKKEELKPSQARTYANGLVVEELKMGKTDGKRASPGTKVSVNYIGKLKKDGKIFDSNVGRAPFKFRLGVGEVIKGWDVGVNGMRIGDKRRITIPPSMGYGSKGAGGKIPPNAWLVFDVELVDVR